MTSTFDERLTLGPRTRWFWDPLACRHVSRYLFAQSWVRGHAIIDVGCGTGYGSAILARDRRRRVLGIDVSREVIDVADASWPSFNLHFAVGDALDLDLTPGSADTVVSFETIEHVADPSRFLDQIADLLKPNGRLILSTPDRTYYSPGAGPGESHNPFHPSELTRRELLDLIAVQFRLVATYGQGRIDRDELATEGLSSGVKRMVKKITDPVIGRGPIAEALLGFVRRNHVPRPLDDAGYAYVVVVCDKRPEA
jgi:SAM-dependent methyltransferase